MKRKIQLFLSFIALGFSCIKAQMNIGSTSPANNDAALQVTSTTKGILFPKVALSNTISSSPMSTHVQGMVVYNTATVNDVVPGLYSNDGLRWSLISNYSGTNATFTSGTISCGGTLSGTYQSNTAMTIANTKTITISVATVGSYSAYSTFQNGVSFGTSSKLLATGPSSIVLNAYGIPTASGTFTYTVNIGGQICSFPVNFAPAGTVSLNFLCSSTAQVQIPAGSLTNNASYTGSYIIPYANGDGTAYPAATQMINGLTLARVPGTYTSGSAGNVMYNLSGNYSGTTNGMVSFTIPECASTASFGDPILAAIVAVSGQGCANCIAYQNAPVDSWVVINSAEYNSLKSTANIKYVNTYGVPDITFANTPTYDYDSSLYSYSLNGVASAVPLGDYPIAMAVRFSGIYGTSGLQLKFGLTASTGYTNYIVPTPSISPTILNSSNYLVIKRPSSPLGYKGYIGLYAGGAHLAGDVANGGTIYVQKGDVTGAFGTDLQLLGQPQVQVVSTPIKSW